MPSDNETGPANSFEQAFGDLRGVVESLESGGLTLEAATALFEKGMLLAKDCNVLLKNAELKITKLHDDWKEEMELIAEQDSTDISTV